MAFAVFTEAPRGQQPPPPAWQQSTAYPKWVTRVRADTDGAKAYQCMQTGVSASSGSGPTGTGSVITDGTCIWRYTGPAYVKVYKTAHAVGNPSNSGGPWPDDGAYAVFALPNSSATPTSTVDPTDFTQQMMTVFGGPSQPAAESIAVNRDESSET